MIEPEITGEKKEIIINKNGTKIRRFFHQFEKCEDYLGYKYTVII